MLSVIGLGFPRTGTMSLKLALERLGYGPCYHMIEVFDRPDDIDRWRRAIHEPGDWDALFDGFQSTSDAPGCYFWRELTAKYPTAKCILTVRDAETWYSSFLETAYEAIIHPERSQDQRHRDVQHMAKELILDAMFEGHFEDKQHAIEIYDLHNRMVQESIDSQRLLVFEVGQGWKPLCDFLSTDIPDEPFPHLNTRMEFRDRFHVDQPQI